jgi:glutamine synthetase
LSSKEIVSQEDIFETLKTGKVDYVRVEFVDLLGNTRGKSLRRAEFEEVLNGKGVEFAEGLVVLDYAEVPLFSSYYDVIAVPDLSTFKIIPYLERTARVLSYLTTLEGARHELCVRSALYNVLKKLEERNLSLYSAFEPTFYLVKQAGDGTIRPADDAKAFSPEGLWDQQEFLKNLIKYLELLDVKVSSINKHYGQGQYELKFSLSSPIESADQLISSREVIRDLARSYGMLATFMPKPFSEQVSSSMDVYLSFHRGKDSVMLDPTDPKGHSLSQIGYNILAGIVHHLHAIMAFAAPTVNSYRRFKEKVVPNRGGVGHERHFVIRLTSTFKENGLFEFRLADPLANPYLFLASVVASAIDGIEDNMDIEIEKDVTYLPETLEEAINALKQDSVIVRSLGNALVDAYIKLKKRELDAYTNYVSEWEIRTYLKAGW